MLTREENLLLTQVGRGTPCGELLRRYWHPVAAAAELTNEKPMTVSTSQAARNRTGNCFAPPDPRKPRQNAGHTSHGKRIAGSNGR